MQATHDTQAQRGREAQLQREGSVTEGERGAAIEKWLAAMDVHELDNELHDVRDELLAAAKTGSAHLVGLIVCNVARAYATRLADRELYGIEKGVSAVQAASMAVYGGRL